MIEKIKRQSNAWLLSGIAIVFVLSILGYKWNSLNSPILLVLGIIGISGAIIWWFWTMFIMRQLIKHRVEEEIALREIIERIKELRIELRKSLSRKRKK